MNKINYLNHIIHTPETLFRRFDFDLSSAPEQAKRIALVALPFVALYRPIGSALSIGMGGCRVVSHLYHAIIHEENKEWKQLIIKVGQLALAIVSLSTIIFNFTTGLFITTGVDLAQSCVLVPQLLLEKEYAKAGEESLQSIGSAFYLIFMTTGALELILLATLVQGLICLYQAKDEIEQGRYLEAIGKLAMAPIRLHQVNHYRQLIVRRNALMTMQKYQALFERSLRGRRVRHLIESPLGDLPSVIDEKRAILANQNGEYDFGSHTHGYGKGLVKGANLTFRQISVNGAQMTEVEFKVNHVFRDQIEKAFQDLSKMNRKELSEILQLSGSHIKGISYESFKLETFGNESIKNHVINMEGLGTISIGASKELPNLYDRIVIRMDSNKSLYDLHEMMAFADLDIALCMSNENDLNRLKMGHLFRTFYPSKALPFERTEEFFSLSTEQLKASIIAKAPQMEEIFDKYLDRMTPVEILPGRVRYAISGLADEVREAGGLALTTAITGAYHSEELYERIASILSMGIIASELKDQNHINYQGLGDDYFTGGADSVCTQMITQKNIQEKMPVDALYYSPAHLLISLDALELGTYQYYTDSFANRLTTPMWWWEDYFTHPDILTFTNQIQTQNSASWYWEYSRHEVMLKERVDPSFFKGIILNTEQTKIELIEFLRKRDLIKRDTIGRETILNVTLDRFFRVGQYVSEDLVS